MSDGRVSFPSWPPSQYLARMAATAPSEVAEILSGIQTDNSTIIGDIVTAANQMPMTVAKSLVPVISKAASDDALWVYFKAASDLTISLLENGQVQSAMLLARTMYKPRLREGQTYFNPRDIYWYTDGLKAISPLFAKLIPSEFLPLICSWLRVVVQAKTKNSTDYLDDHSFIWRPAIEEHEYNDDFEFASVLSGIIREAFETAIDATAISLSDALTILDSEQFSVFKRLRIHLINKFAERDTAKAIDTILTRELIDDYACKHEYARLLKERFQLMTKEQQLTWLGWVEEESSINSSKYVDSSVTEEQRRNWLAHYKFEKLHWIRNHLVNSHRDFYDEMVGKFGEPEMADMNVRYGMSFADEVSPISVEQLKSIPFEDAVSVVSTWRPSESRTTEESFEGLSSTFEDYISTNPVEFSGKATALNGCPANLIRVFLSQMKNAVKSGEGINWQEVLKLCEWVVRRPINEQTIESHLIERMVDRSWQWTRDEIARFISELCQNGLSDLNDNEFAKARVEIWNLLMVLINSPASPYMGYSPENKDPRICDYLDYAINSPRGKSVEAAFDYARFVCEYLQYNEKKLGGFDAIPEFREMLETQICKGNRSFEVMAVLGSRLPLIYTIDKKWIADNAERLFLLDEIESQPSAAYGWAAWNAFLVWVRPHSEFFLLFKSQFSFAVDQSALIPTITDNLHQPMFHLGEHLMMLYAHGHIDLNEPDQLMRRFLNHAKSETRRHAITFIGMNLRRTTTPRPEIIQRLQVLWDEYWEIRGKEDARDSRNSSLFGEWFVSGAFPVEWALDRLEKFIDVNPRPQMEHLIMESLAANAKIDLPKTMRILDKIIRNDAEGWRIETCKSEIKTILSLALKSGDTSHDVARQLINYLGRRGYFEFGELHS